MVRRPDYTHLIFTGGSKMNVSRNFLLVAVVYLLIGMVIGGYMGASDDHSLTPVHAHLNLLGFTLMALFAAIYKVFPSMAQAALARYHFWLHQAGTLVMMVMLYLLTKNMVAVGAAVGIVMTLTEAAVIIGIVLFGLNALRHAR